MIRHIAGGDMLMFESVQRAAKEMEAQLLGPTPSHLERLAVERVVACWLALQHTDVVCTTEKNLTQAKFWAQQQDRASRRYEAAVKLLLDIRRAPSPAMCQSRQAMTTVEATASRPAEKPSPAAGFEKGRDSLERGYKPATAGNGNGVPRDARPDEDPTHQNGQHGQPANRILRFGAAPVSTPNQELVFTR